MFEQKLESLGKTNYDVAVDVGVNYGKIAVIVLAVDLALTLITMSIISLMNTLNVNGDMISLVVRFLNLGEMLAAVVFLAVIVIFLVSGMMAIKKTPGFISVAQAVCISAVSGLITGAMASIVLVVSMIAITLFGMPQTGYLTMFTKFTPDSVFDVLKWAVVIALLAIAAGITYGGMTKKIKRLF